MESVWLSDISTYGTFEKLEETQALGLRSRSAGVPGFKGDLGPRCAHRRRYLTLRIWTSATLNGMSERC